MRHNGRAIIKEAKISRRNAKAALTRAAKSFRHTLEGARPAEEVRQSLEKVREAYEMLIVKHENYTKLIDDDDEFKKPHFPVNLTFLSKTLERMAARQLNQYLNINNLYAPMQSAYRANYSTETALLRVHNDINIALDSHKEVILVLLDLTSAFDMIDHVILLDRLHANFGLSGTVFQWFASYLVNRTQSVMIGDSQSTVCHLKCGKL